MLRIARGDECESRFVLQQQRKAWVSAITLMKVSATTARSL
jgi:hypothetical protein